MIIKKMEGNEVITATDGKERLENFQKSSLEMI